MVKQMQQARKIHAGERFKAVPQPAGDSRREPRPGRRLKKVKLLMIITISFLLSLAVVAQYSSLVILNNRLGGARTELAAVNKDIRMLEMEVAGLGSIGRIERIARDELGLVEPEIGQIRVLNAGGLEADRQGE